MCSRSLLARFIALLSVVALLGSGFGPNHLEPTTAHAQQPQAAPDRILVGFRSGTSATDSIDAHGRVGAMPVGRISRLNVDVVQVAPGSVGSALAVYQSDPNVLFAEPDFEGEATETPNDQYYSKQWGMAKVQANYAWDKTKGSSGVKIAILDTGIDLDHADLKSKIVATKNFTGNNCASNVSVDDKNGHGTHVAGIAAAVTNNGTGVAGLGRNSSLMVGKVLDDAGKGYYSWWICGITWAADNGAKVINLSLGGTSASTALQNAINYAWGKGVVVVAAAGNNRTTAAFYPAYYSNAIAVASTNSGDALSTFSNRGTWVDLAAPGEGIYSTLPNSGSSVGKDYGSLSGTSMAAPHVSGLAALVWANGGSSASNVRGTLESSADKISGTGSSFKHGRINAAKAVGASTSPPSNNTPPPNNNTTPPTNNITPTPTPTPTIAPPPPPAPKFVPTSRRRR